MNLETSVAGAMAGIKTGISHPSTIADVAASYGGNGPLVAAMTGITDRNDKTFKATMRGLQRWERWQAGERGPNVRQPNAATVAQIMQLGEERYAEAGRDVIHAQGLHVKFSGMVIVSPKGKRPDERERTFEADLRGDTLDAFLDALARGDATEAADQFNFDLLAAYGLPGSAVISDVDSLAITIGAETGLY